MMVVGYSTEQARGRAAGKRPDFADRSHRVRVHTKPTSYNMCEPNPGYFTNCTRASTQRSGRERAEGASEQGPTGDGHHERER